MRQIKKRNPRERREDPDSPAALEAFDDLWRELFSTPVHLDSALSKRDKSVKSALAQLIQPILLRPVSTAEGLGLRVYDEEPWTLDTKRTRNWKLAREIAFHLFDGMSAGLASKLRAGGSKTPEKDFPPFMIDAWESAFNDTVASSLARALSSEPPLSLRVTTRATAQAVLEELTRENKLPVKASLSSISPQGITLSGFASVLNTETYKKGLFEIQDEGSQAMSFFSLWPELFERFLSVRPGEPPKAELPTLPESAPAWTIVDACAGAGGKTLALADALRGKGRVYGYDVSDTKLQALKRRATRAGLNNIQAVRVEEGNEKETVKRFRRRANLVLVDAPCTGWGVLRRNPDIKWRQDEETLARMPEIQIRLLDAYSELVAPGGRLVFGVCTFRPEETTSIVERFLESHPDFERRQGGYLGPGGPLSCDGFFMQAFQRKGKAAE